MAAALWPFLGWAGPAAAYIGPSFLEVPGVTGDQRGPSHKGWVRLESNYWGAPSRSVPVYEGKRRTFFSGPLAPRDGSGSLSLALDKRSRALAPLMALCARHVTVPELTYAESADRARPPAEVGDRPADIPEYYEYELKDVTLQCPTVAAAPEQAVVLHFNAITWRNYQGSGHELVTTPAKLPPAQKSGRTLAYVVSLFTTANNVAPDQCPVMSTGPTETEYFALKSADQIAAEKAKYAGKGGVIATFQTGAIALRGPDGLSVTQLPGIVAEPAQPTPRLAAPAVSFDASPRDAGRAAKQTWPNRLFAVEGCIKGFGRKGILTVTTTESRRNGEISMMLLISGVDDERDDDHVDVTIFYSQDPMVKSADGKTILPGFTFRVSDDAQRTPYFQRLRGRIVDGVVITDPVEVIQAEKSREMGRFYDGRLRLELHPDGTLKGVLWGYQDWRTIANFWGGLSAFENGMGYKMPSAYVALRDAADGLRNPLTGRFDGISSAYDIEGVSAFVPPEEEQALLSPGVAYAGK